MLFENVCKRQFWENIGLIENEIASKSKYGNILKPSETRYDVEPDEWAWSYYLTID